MQFGVVSGVGQRMGVLDGSTSLNGKGRFGGILTRWFEWRFWVYF